MGVGTKRDVSFHSFTVFVRAIFMILCRLYVQPCFISLLSVYVYRFCRVAF